MATLTAQELINLASAESARHTISTSPDANGNVTLSDPKQPSNRQLDQHVKASELRSRTVRAASIMLAESGGKTDAFRPASQNPRGGNDRGLWQINSKAHPDVSDMAAFDPNASTAIAYQLSAGFAQWGPWRGSKGLDPNSTPSTTIATAYESMTGGVHDDTPILSQIDPDANGIPNALGGLLGWAEALGRLLSHLIDPGFWKRIGIGALGAAALVVGIVALLKDSIPTPLGAALKGAK